MLSVDLQFENVHLPFERKMGRGEREGKKIKRETVFSIICGYISHVTFRSHLMLCADLQFENVHLISEPNLA